MQEGAYADVTVKLGLIKVLHKEVDLCEEAYVLYLILRCGSLIGTLFSRSAEVDISCPVEPGTYKVKHTVELPSQIPPGKTLAFRLLLGLTRFRSAF